MGCAPVRPRRQRPPHGGGGAPLWLPFMETLSQRFDVIVPEHPGFGASDTPDWLDQVGDLAYFYLDVIDALANGESVPAFANVLEEPNETVGSLLTTAAADSTEAEDRLAAHHAQDPVQAH